MWLDTAVLSDLGRLAFLLCRERRVERVLTTIRQNLQRTTGQRYLSRKSTQPQVNTFTSTLSFSIHKIPERTLPSQRATVETLTTHHC